jgi:hypothetical protein
MSLGGSYLLVVYARWLMRSPWLALYKLDKVALFILGRGVLGPLE